MNFITFKHSTVDHSPAFNIPKPKVAVNTTKINCHTPVLKPNSSSTVIKSKSLRNKGGQKMATYPMAVVGDTPNASREAKRELTNMYPPSKRAIALVSSSPGK